MKLHFREVGSDPYSKGVTPLLFTGSALGTSTHDEDALEENLVVGQNRTPTVLQQRMSSSTRPPGPSQPNSRCSNGPALLYILGILVAFAIPFCVPLAFSRAIRVFDRLSISSVTDIHKNAPAYHELQAANSIERTGLETRTFSTSQYSPPSFQNHERGGQAPRLPENHFIPSGQKNDLASVPENTKQPRANIVSTMTDCATMPRNTGGEGDSRPCSSSASAGTSGRNPRQPEMGSTYVRIDKGGRTLSSRMAPYPSSHGVKQLPSLMTHESGMAVPLHERPNSDLLNSPDMRATEGLKTAKVTRDIEQDGSRRPSLAPRVSPSSEMAIHTQDPQRLPSPSSDLGNVEVQKISDPWSEHVAVQNEHLYLSKTFENRLNADVGPVLAANEVLWGDYPALCNEGWKVSFLLDQSPNLEAEMELTVACGEGQTCTIRPRLHNLNGVRVSTAGTDDKVHYVRTFTPNNVESHRWGPLKGPLRVTLLGSSTLVARRNCKIPAQSRSKFMSVEMCQKYLRAAMSNLSTLRVPESVSSTDNPFVYEAHPHYHIQISEENKVSTAALK
jgi:hypothetical protein